MNRRRITATIIKERILLFRDPGGLVMLIAMPIMLIIAMALVQDGPFKDYQDVGFKVVWVDNDQKPLGDSLRAMFEKSGRFTLIDSYKGIPVTEELAKKLVEEGEYPLGVLIPKGSYSEMLNRSNKLINTIGKASGQPSIIPVRPGVDSLQITLFFDPIAKATIRMAIQNGIEKMLFKIQLDMLFDKMHIPGNSTESEDLGGKENESLLADNIIVENLGKQSMPTFIMSSVQHNVPAWIVFAIFFLIIPLSGNFIKEKKEGSRLLLDMTPGSFIDIILGKVIFYSLFGLFQFLSILIASRVLLPLVDLPVLEMNQSIFPAIVAAAGISFAAVSFGVLVGSLFNTYHQAMMFGSVTIVILSALGGIWVPIEVLPYSLQLVAELSPLQWGLSLFQDVFVRGITWDRFFLKLCLLIVFGVVCLIISTIHHDLQKKKVGF
ncbi:MAG: ABC transporter permease [Saprospiraceae bacterium]|nr:ABC transporter permease [Saprospiraceae bacterium]